MKPPQAGFPLGGTLAAIVCVCDWRSSATGPRAPARWECWESARLYAPPGAAVSVRLASAAGTGRLWRLRVGCHTDDISAAESWARWPAVTAEYDLPAAGGAAVEVRPPRSTSVLTIICPGFDQILTVPGSVFKLLAR